MKERGKTGLRHLHDEQGEGRADGDADEGDSFDEGLLVHPVPREQVFVQEFTTIARVLDRVVVLPALEVVDEGKEGQEQEREH